MFWGTEGGVDRFGALPLYMPQEYVALNISLLWGLLLLVSNLP